MKEYIITTMLDVVLLHCFCFVFSCCLVSLHGDYSNVSVQYNGGLLPDIILLTQGYYHRGIKILFLDSL